jgi:hypothetical protein
MLPTPTLSQPDANSLPPPPAPPPAPKITRGHSCILCQQRKVRCDRGKPACGNCVKARAECVPSAPTQPRRRRRKLTEIDLVGRLRRYESLLKSHGIKTDDDSPSEEAEENQVPRLSMTVPRARHHERGALFTNKENSHYVEKYACLSTHVRVPLLMVEVRSGRISEMKSRIRKMPSKVHPKMR